MAADWTRAAEEAPAHWLRPFARDPPLAQPDCFVVSLRDPAARVRGEMEAAERAALGAAAEAGGGSEAFEAVIAAELALLDGALGKGAA